MEFAVVALSVAVCVLSFCVAVLAGSVPFLWWQLQKQKREIDTLDEALAALLERSEE